MTRPLLTINDVRWFVSSVAYDNYRDLDTLVTKKQALKIFRVKLATLDSYIAKGMPTVRVDGQKRVFIDIQEANEWLRLHRYRGFKEELCRK